MVDQIYVIGHVNPDTDSIAAAMGYAWLLRERDGVNRLRRAQVRLTRKPPGC
jgi:inorganic pyrophosphatase/exopolyphosphatase